MDAADHFDNFVPLMESCGYSVKKFLGCGAFGSVSLCTRSDTKEAVAVKAIIIKDDECGQEEVENLELLRQLDPDKNNLIRFNRHVKLQGHFFLEFEKLDMTLRDLLIYSSRPLHLSEIQVIAQDMLVALNALKNIRIVHADISLDNIMLINHQLQPFRVKLIDFGTARDVSELYLGYILHDLQHRAPEILLGLPLSEAVDMWALGSLIASVYMLANMYSGKCILENMADIVQLHGQPDHHLLSSGIYTEKYFYKDNDTTWKLKTECSCFLSSGSFLNSSWSSESSGSDKSGDESTVHQVVIDTSSRLINSLDHIMRSRPGTAGYEDTQAFISLLKEMLQVDPEKRIEPSKALRHSFITMKRFPSDKVPDHVNTSASTDENPPEEAHSNDDTVAGTLPVSAYRVSEEK